MPAQERPRLVAVEDPLPERSRPAGPAGPAAARRLIWALAAALALVLVLFAAQVQRSAHLRTEVARLESQLEASRALVDAYRQRLSDVREAVGGLSERLGALQDLVRDEPVPGASAPAPAPPQDQP